jgi:VIT1/CCC1 family predicted Fe2+/Mn2+ transporter
MIGLNTSTGSRIVVIGGILTIAVADAFSDALGIHMSEDANKRRKHSLIWLATFATFFTKLIVACTFLIPFLFLGLDMAIKVNIIWGLSLLIFFNYILAKQRGEEPIRAVGVHVGIAAIVIIISSYLGKLIAIWFS